MVPRVYKSFPQPEEKVCEKRAVNMHHSLSGVFLILKVSAMLLRFSLNMETTLQAFCSEIIWDILIGWGHLGDGQPRALCNQPNTGAEPVTWILTPSQPVIRAKHIPSKHNKGKKINTNSNTGAKVGYNVKRKTTPPFLAPEAGVLGARLVAGVLGFPRRFLAATFSSASSSFTSPSPSLSEMLFFVDRRLPPAFAFLPGFFLDDSFSDSTSKFWNRDDSITLWKGCNFTFEAVL